MPRRALARDRHAAVDDVRAPDERGAALDAQFLALEPARVHQRGDGPLVAAVVGRLGPDAEIVEVVLGELVRSRIVEERPVLPGDVLERDPDAAHEARWQAAEVDLVRMAGLLRSARKVQRLE